MPFTKAFCKRIESLRQSTANNHVYCCVHRRCTSHGSVSLGTARNPRPSSTPTKHSALYKSTLLRRTECRRRCPMPLSPYACHCRLSQSPQPSSTISARLAARYRVEFRLPLLPLFHNSHLVAVAICKQPLSRLTLVVVTAVKIPFLAMILDIFICIDVRNLLLKWDLPARFGIYPCFVDSCRG